MTQQHKRGKLEGELFCDGGARGNPGPAAAAFILRASNDGGSGKVLASAGIYIGVATNNEAEYKAVIIGVRAALERGISKLTIRADSELVVRQLKGEYRVKSENLKRLFDEAKGLLERVDWWEVRHIPRELNQEADALVNRALDLATDRGDVGRTDNL